MLVSAFHSTITKFTRLLGTVLFLVVVLSLVAPVTVSAQAPDPTDQFGLNQAQELGLGTADLVTVIVRVVQVALSFVGLIAVILLIYGGFVWMTSGGDAKKIDQAKAIIRNALIGIVIILLAYAIVTFIFNIFGPGRRSGGTGPDEPCYITGNCAYILGSGILEAHYPVREQRDVPRNTKIVVTFKVPMDPRTIINDTTNDGVYGNCANGLCDSIARHTDGDGNAVPHVRIAQRDGVVNNFVNPDDWVAATTDEKTFVFVQKNCNQATPGLCIGNANDKTWYVTTLTNDIARSTGEPAFGGLGSYDWQFEVSTALDLTPPQVTSVIPVPDNAPDDYTATGNATQAVGGFTVSNIPRTAVAASATISGQTPGTPANLEINGSYSGPVNDTVTVTINAGGATANIVWANQAINSNANSPVSNNAINIGSGLSIQATTGNFTGGNQFTVNVVGAVVPDTITVGTITFVFVAAGQPATPFRIPVAGTNNALATNIAVAINRDMQGVPLPQRVNANSVVNGVFVVAEQAGVSGNSIGIISSNTGAIGVSAPTLLGGTAETQTAACQPDNASCDEPRNTIIQINFSEGVDPITVTGAASKILVDYNLDVLPMPPGAFHKQLCDTNHGGDDNWTCNAVTKKCNDGTSDTTLDCSGKVSGIFSTSNQYQTVEFRTNYPCAVNSCGQQIYCFDAMTNIITSVLAATLNPQTTGPDAQLSPPGSPTLYDGVVDLASNSFDGNANGVAQGPNEIQSPQPTPACTADADCNASFQCVNAICQKLRPSFDLNVDPPVPTNGDNMRWSFWVSDDIDLTAPAVVWTDPAWNVSNVNTLSPLQVRFSKLMRSDTLKPDSGYAEFQEPQQSCNAHSDCNTEQDFSCQGGVCQRDQHSHLTVFYNASRPVGYWVSKENMEDPEQVPDGRFDHTRAFVQHTPFARNSLYGIEMGSGLQDTRQNCYNPAGDNPDTNYGNGTYSHCVDDNQDSEWDTPPAGVTQGDKYPSCTALDCDTIGGRTCNGITQFCSTPYRAAKDTNSCCLSDCINR